MSKFNVGDRVRIIDKENYCLGMLGTIKDVLSGDYCYYIDLDSPIKIDESTTMTSAVARENGVESILPQKPNKEWADIWDSNG